MIEQSRYLPKQMTGPVVNSVMAGLEKRLEDADIIEDYLYGLSIETAQETELENIGRIIGYPRPLVPESFAQENLFLFTTTDVLTDISIGFSRVGGEVGGRLSTVKSSRTDYMNLDLYRKFLDKVAYIKRYGITIYSLDMIAKLIDDEYTIEYDENADITISFERNIGYKNLWILQSLFNRLAIMPSVTVYSGTED